MGRHLDWLTVELERQAEAKVEPLALRAWIDEVRAHVEASAAAHAELGLDEIEAEKAAVRSFGEPIQIAQSWISAVQPQAATKGKDRVLLVGTSAASAYWMFWLMIAHEQLTWPAISIGMALFALFFVIRSFYSRSFQALSLLKLGLAVTAVTALVFSLGWVDLYKHGGIGVMQRWKAASMNEQINYGLAQLQPMLAEIELGRRAFKDSPETARAAGFSTQNGYRVVLGTEDWARTMRRPSAGQDFHLGPDGAWENSGNKYVYIKDFGQAAKAWRSDTLVLEANLRNRIDVLDRNHKAIPEALSAPVLSSIADIGPQVTSMGLVWTLALLVVHSLVWFIRSIHKIYRRIVHPWQPAG